MEYFPLGFGESDTDHAIMESLCGPELTAWRAVYAQWRRMRDTGVSIERRLEFWTTKARAYDAVKASFLAAKSRLTSTDLPTTDLPTTDLPTADMLLTVAAA